MCILIFCLIMVSTYFSIIILTQWLTKFNRSEDAIGGQWLYGFMKVDQLHFLFAGTLIKFKQVLINGNVRKGQSHKVASPAQYFTIHKLVNIFLHGWVYSIEGTVSSDRGIYLVAHVTTSWSSHLVYFSAFK